MLESDPTTSDHILFTCQSCNYRWIVDYSFFMDCNKSDCPYCNSYNINYIFISNKSRKTIKELLGGALKKKDNKRNEKAFELDKLSQVMIEQLQQDDTTDIKALEVLNKQLEDEMKQEDADNDA